MPKNISTALASEFIGDAADCLLNAVETLREVDNCLPNNHRESIKSLIASIESNKVELERLRSAVHSRAFSPVSSSLPQFPMPARGQRTISPNLLEMSF